MRVLVLGGYGTFGRNVSKNLCANDLVSEMVIGGRDLAAAKGFARELGDKARAVRMDACQEGDVKSDLKGMDLLVNTAGPDYKVSFPAAEAAIQTGTDYCDLCADCDTTVRLLRMDRDARSADATILLGMGFGPGETNLLMKHAVMHLDTVEDVRLMLAYNLVGMISRFGIDDPAKAASEMRRTGRVNASWETVMNWAGGRVCVFRNNRLVDVDPSKHQEIIELPGGGSSSFFPVGGTEAVTIPHFLRNVASASFMMSVRPPQVSGFYLSIADRIRRKEIDPKEATILFHEGVAAKAREDDSISSWKTPGIDLWAVAVGTRDGRRVRYSCWPSWGFMGASSALTVAALRILRGDVKNRGVLAPEACFEPMDFFQEAAQLSSKDSQKGDLLKGSFTDLGQTKDGGLRI